MYVCPLVTPSCIHVDVAGFDQLVSHAEMCLIKLLLLCTDLNSVVALVAAKVRGIPILNNLAR